MAPDEDAWSLPRDVIEAELGGDEDDRCGEKREGVEVYKTSSSVLEARGYITSS